MKGTLASLPTPAAVVELGIVEKNCAKMSSMARSRGVALRPHVKTHKCVEAARIAVGDHFGGITVSTLAEAEHFSAAGFDDITYAVPVAMARIPQAIALSRRLRHFQLLVDHADTVTELAERAAAASTSLNVLLKIDCGYHRAGVEPHRPEAMALVSQIANSPHLHFAGLLTHAGHSYACVGREAIARVAAQEREVIVAFATEVRARGIEVSTVSVGSTPTMSVAPDLAGVTEIRPGNYVFYDAFQASIGSCTAGDAAFSVLTTVIGAFPSDGRLIIDAGALALSKDVGASHLPGPTSYGLLRAEDGSPLSDLSLTSLSQEHGIVRGTKEAVKALPIGSRLRVIANHSCLAAACHAQFHVVRGEQIVETWSPVTGW